MSWKSAATILFALFALHASNAAASDTFTGLSQGTRVSLEPNEYGEVFTFDLVAQVKVLPKLMLDVDVPWAADFGDSSLDSIWATGAFGDVRVGAHTVVQVAPNVVLHLGGSVSVPTNSDDADGLASFDAAMIRAFFDQDRFLPGAVSFRVPFGAEFRFGPFFLVRSDLTPVVFVAVGNAAPFAGRQALLEHSDEVEFRSRSGWGGGLRFQVALGLSPGLPFNLKQWDDEVAFEAFGVYEPPDRGVFARFGAFFIPAAPVGYSLTAPGYPLVQLQIGYKF